MAKIRKIEPVMPTLPTRKKVAAYARVSMETERLHHSLSAQVSYYSDLMSMLTTASQAQRRIAERNSSACWRIARPGKSTSS